MMLVLKMLTKMSTMCVFTTAAPKQRRLRKLYWPK